jgi:hypothetical protein
MASNMVPQVRVAPFLHSSTRLWLTYKQEELPVLESLIQIRNRLTALKKVSHLPLSREFAVVADVF